MAQWNVVIARSIFRTPRSRQRMPLGKSVHWRRDCLLQHVPQIRIVCCSLFLYHAYDFLGNLSSIFVSRLAQWIGQSLEGNLILPISRLASLRTLRWWVWLVAGKSSCWAEETQSCDEIIRYLRTSWGTRTRLRPVGDMPRATEVLKL